MNTTATHGRWPNFFIVGAPRCGTTAMYSYLRRHPDVFLPPQIKEPHFFAPDLDSGNEHDGQFFVRTEPEYLELFAEAGEAVRVGEASTMYLYSEVAPSRIKETCPGCKVVIGVRDPVEIMYSFHSKRLRRGTEDIIDFEEALNAEPDRKRGLRIPPETRIRMGLQYREVGTLSSRIERYLELYDRRDILFVVYDDFAADTTREFRRVLRFLDVDPTFQLEFWRVNSNRRPRSQWLEKVRRNPAVLAIGRRLLPQAMRGRLVAANFSERPRPAMEADLRRRLQAEFEPEVRRLSDLLDRDLTHWSRGEGA